LVKREAETAHGAGGGIGAAHGAGGDVGAARGVG
jgi:hypothetical protein